MSVDIRQQLIDAGIVILERDGLPALSVRKLAAEVGTSTMVVYTHFGSMTGVVDAVAGEAFARFAQALADVPHTDDPVADFLSIGTAYRRFAIDKPQRYQLIALHDGDVVLASVREERSVRGAE